MSTADELRLDRARPKWFVRMGVYDSDYIPPGKHVWLIYRPNALHLSAVSTGLPEAVRFINEEIAHG